jgi:hypothetical protein
MLFAVVAPPDRRHIADIPRFGGVTTAEMIVLKTLHRECNCSKSFQAAANRRPIRRLRLIIWRPSLVFIRARNPRLRIRLILLILRG